MAKRTSSVRRVYVKAKRRRRAGLSLPLAILAGFAPIGYSTWYGYKADGLRGAAGNLGMGMTGYDFRDGKYKLNYHIQGLGPILLGAAVHKVANRLGVNRFLSRAGIPLLRV